MRVSLVIAVACLPQYACIVLDSDPCQGAEEVVNTSAILAPGGQNWLSTPAAAGECHASFYATIAYTGEDAYDGSLPTPNVDVSASAIGTGGEQPGLLGIITAWTQDVDDATDQVYWRGYLSAGAKNIDAPAVNYMLAAVGQPGETRPVSYYAEIAYKVPATDDEDNLIACAP